VGVAAAGVRVATAEAGAGVGGGAGLLLWRGELGRGGGAKDRKRLRCLSYVCARAGCGCCVGCRAL